MNHILLASMGMIFFTLNVYAQNYDPKFDQGVNLKEFVKAAAENSSRQSFVPVPNGVIETVKTISVDNERLQSLRKEFPKPAPGYFYGPYPPRIYNSVPYQDGKPYVPLLQAHESQMAYELLGVWDTINTTRANLLDEANILDPKDKTLYAEGVQLDQNAAALNQERDKLNAEIAQFNQTCVWAPYPPSYCHSWSIDLDRRIADLKRRIAAHNAEVDKWRIRKGELDDEVGSFIKKILSWESAIMAFINDAKAVLSSHGTCTEAQWRPLYEAVKAACDVPGGRSCEPGQNCPTLQKNLAQNRACLKAREKIKNECYANIPDQGHDTAIQEAKKAIDRCLRIMNAMVPPCPDPGAFSFPMRRYGGY